MNYLAFNKEWFNKHQKKLFWLLNTPGICVWFRWVLCIDSKEIINRIEPNAYWFGARRRGDGTEVRADFRTHWKYSKRLYYAFKPLWWSMHVWDLLVDGLVPQLSFGFDTLTAFPDPDPETTTVDGRVLRQVVSESFSTIRAGAGTLAEPSSATPRVGIFASGTVDEYTNLERYIALFDTSSIDDANTISAATFSLMGFAKGETITGQSVGVVASTPASNTDLVAADYSQLGITRFAGDLTIASFSITGYNDFAFNASGLAAISKTGITKLGVCVSCDLDNTAPTWVSTGNARANFRSADQAGTTEDPKLVITHALVVTPGGTIPTLLLMGVG
jgi:hypothetical protein